MTRSALVHAGLFALLLLAALPGAEGQRAPPNPSGDVAGRPEIALDSTDCLAHPGWTNGVTCTVLYAHIFNLLDKAPINVQFPHAICPDIARGFSSTPTIEPFFAQNHMDFWSTAGFVEYEEGFIDENGYCVPEVHPERGLTADVLLSPDVPVHFFWYLSADTDDVSMASDPRQVDTGAMPCVTVRVEIQSGRQFGSGRTLAEGQATRTVVSTNLTAGGSTPVPDPCAEGELVEQRFPAIEVAQAHEFPVVLSVAEEPITKTEGFVVRVEWWQAEQPGGEKVAQREWNVRTGSEHRSRLVLPVLNPVVVQEVRPQLFLDTIYVHGVFNSPWGSYDVDPDSLMLDIVDEALVPVADPDFGEPIYVYSVDHDGHFIPVNMTVPWNFHADALPPGTYKARMTMKNWQHTATAASEATMTFGEAYDRLSGRIELFSSDGVRQRNIVRREGGGGGGGSGGDSGEEGKLPGFAAGPLLVVLLAAAALARRNR